MILAKKKLPLPNTLKYARLFAVKMFLKIVSKLTLLVSKKISYFCLVFWVLRTQTHIPAEASVKLVFREVSDRNELTTNVKTLSSNGNFFLIFFVPLLVENFEFLISEFLILPCSDLWYSSQVNLPIISVLTNPLWLSAARIEVLSSIVDSYFQPLDVQDTETSHFFVNFAGVLEQNRWSRKMRISIEMSNAPKPFSTARNFLYSKHLVSKRFQDKAQNKFF